jgi:hypothetical protein
MHATEDVARITPSFNRISPSSHFEPYISKTVSSHNNLFDLTLIFNIVVVARDGRPGVLSEIISRVAESPTRIIHSRSGCGVTKSNAGRLDSCICGQRLHEDDVDAEPVDPVNGNLSAVSLQSSVSTEFLANLRAQIGHALSERGTGLCRLTVIS